MRRPQFSLKTMLWLMALVAIGCVVIPKAIVRYARWSLERQTSHWGNGPPPDWTPPAGWYIDWDNRVRKIGVEDWEHDSM